MNHNAFQWVEIATLFKGVGGPGRAGLSGGGGGGFGLVRQNRLGIGKG